MSSWKVKGMERKALEGANQNVIISISWECEHLEVYNGSNYIGRRFGVVSLPSPSDTFIPFTQITEETALFWCKNILGEEVVSAIEDEVHEAAIVCSGQSKATISGMPWE